MDTWEVIHRHCIVEMLLRLSSVVLIETGAADVAEEC